MADHLKEGAVSESSEISFTNIYFWWGGGSSGEAFQGKSGVAERERGLSKASQHRPETHRL